MLTERGGELQVRGNRCTSRVAHLPSANVEIKSEPDFAWCPRLLCPKQSLPPNFCGQKLSQLSRSGVCPFVQADLDRLPIHRHVACCPFTHSPSGYAVTAKLVAVEVAKVRHVVFRSPFSWSALVRAAEHQNHCPPPPVGDARAVMAIVRRLKPSASAAVFRDRSCWAIHAAKRSGPHSRACSRAIS